MTPWKLHPALRAVLSKAAEDELLIPPASIAEQREGFAREIAAQDVPGPDMRVVRDALAQLPETEVSIRLYYPETLPRAPAPCLVFFHGGGWVQGSIQTHDSIVRGLAHWGECVAASIDYRLAPEHPYPTPLDDCVGAVEWLAAHAAAFEVATDRIALGGDSAGGNLAAAAVQQLTARGSVSPKFLLLIYPVTDMRPATESRQLFARGYWVDSLSRFIEQYMGQGADADDPLLSPLRAAALDRWPSTRIVTAGFDPLRDEGRLLAENLLKAGVPCELICYPQYIHGFLSLPALLPESRDVLAETGFALRRGLRTLPA